MKSKVPELEPAAANSPSAKSTGRMRGGRVGNWIFTALVRFGGVRPAYVLLVPVVLYFLWAERGAVKASREYLRRLGRRGSWLSRFWGTYRHLYSYGQILVDRVAFIVGAASRFRLCLDGEEYMRSALAEGKGLILVSAHCGNWEGAAHMLADRLHAPVNILRYDAQEAHLRRFFAGSLKEEPRFRFIEADGSPDCSLAILAALRRGEIVAMHADRALGSHGRCMPFLGSPARFPDGPYWVAAISGAPLIHTFAMRQGTYRYHFRAYPAEHLALGPPQERDQALAQWMGLFVHRLEEQVREFPFQWINFYDFWAQDSAPQKKPPT